MSRLDFLKKCKSEQSLVGLYDDMERRMSSAPMGVCPVNLASSFVKTCSAQSCGKCTPCRIGLHRIGQLMDKLLDGNGDEHTIDLIENTALVVYESSDCAIGYSAGAMILNLVRGFRDDFTEHALHGHCSVSMNQPVPCVAYCPAQVDVPGYVALVNEGRYADAVRLIRKDNPFPTVCALVCEHPCESHCRRRLIDDAINIRGAKLYAIDNCGDVPVPACAPSTGKSIGIIGGGPSGLSAAYFLSLMGHEVTVYERLGKLGGMLRYGIPDYRLPQERLDSDINYILSTGVRVELNTNISDKATIISLKNKHDALYVSIGAHSDKRLGIEGEDCEGVISAVKLLRDIGSGELPDFTGKKVAVIGGGNVAMDVARSSIRLGASNVTVVYRRRQQDMTALQEEVYGAMAESVEIKCLQAPVRIVSDENGDVSALIVKPQIVGLNDRNGRPRPSDSELPEETVDCDIVVVAIGQSIESKPFADMGLSVNHGYIEADEYGSVSNFDNILAGGDCVSGPATVIKAIAAGKAAAASIDTYLGYEHLISTDIEIPTPKICDRPACGRANIKERDANERKNDFDIMELGFTHEEACQETGRCLRCDYYGFGAFKGGRRTQW